VLIGRKMIVKTGTASVANIQEGGNTNVGRTLVLEEGPETHQRAQCVNLIHLKSPPTKR